MVDEPFHLRYGGKVTIVDFVAWPVMGLISLTALVPAIPPAVDWIIIGLGILAAIALLVVASTGAFVAAAWVEGAVAQLTLMLSGFVLGVISTFAAIYHVIARTQEHAFSARVSPLSWIYLSIETWTGSGAGDIFPTIGLTQLLVSLETLTGWIVSLVILATAVAKAFERR